MQPDHVFGHLPYPAKEPSTTSPTSIHNPPVYQGEVPYPLSPVLAWPGKQANYLKYFLALHYFCLADFFWAAALFSLFVRVSHFEQDTVSYPGPEPTPAEDRR